MSNRYFMPPANVQVEVSFLLALVGTEHAPELRVLSALPLQMSVETFLFRVSSSALLTLPELEPV